MQLFDDLINGERVQVLDDQMKKEPIPNLLNDVQGRGLQNGFDVRTLGRFSTLKEIKKAQCSQIKLNLLMNYLTFSMKTIF